MNKNLKDTSVKIDEDTWYYEEPGGIEIIKWVSFRGERKPTHTKISWRKLRASLRRKDAGKTCDVDIDWSERTPKAEEGGEDKEG